MPINMKLWKIENDKLNEISLDKLNREKRLENWIAKDSSILGLDTLLIIGRKVKTGFGGKRNELDLLAIDSEGNLVILELKRDKTPRDVVAQVLDYASWVKKLTQKDIESIARKHLNVELVVAFSNYFGIKLPESINVNHSMIIIASQLDDSSERIVQYLADEYGVNINVIFFNYFKTGEKEFLGRSWLMDPDEVEDKAESRKKGLWSGYWFVNVGEGDHRNWDDCREYGFLSAGQGRKYSDPLKKLKAGDPIFAYMKRLGYVGFGEVTKEAVPVKQFTVDESLGKSLLGLPLKQPNISENSDNPDLSEYVVGINWIKAFPREQAKTFRVVFANQNIVCKLRDQRTLDFLYIEFDINADNK
jgi:hypothetical protein